MLPAFIIAITLFIYVAIALMLPYGIVDLQYYASAGRAASPTPPSRSLEAPASSPTSYNQPDLSDLTDQLHFPAT